MQDKKVPLDVEDDKYLQAGDVFSAEFAYQRPRDRFARYKRVIIALTVVCLWLVVLASHGPRFFRLPTRLPAEDTFLWPSDFFNDHPHKGHRRPGRRLFGKYAEEVFLSVPNNESAIEISRQFATKPHIAGSPGDYQTAIDFLHLLQEELQIRSEEDPIFSAGSHESRRATLSIPFLNEPKAWIDTYYPVMNTPLDRSLDIISEDGDVVWSAQIEEIAEDVLDPDAGKYSTAVPAFHGLSRGGEVEGKLIYVNYGRKQDFDALEAAGVNFTGSIVIARYGGIFRGLKVKGAQEKGAVGCLIYSDPRDDGSVTWDNGYAAYPYGPARNPTSVQRGSVQFISVYPGDPTTPGYPSYENATRTDGENIPQIPSLPISWSTAHRILQEIEEGGHNRTIRLVNHVDDRVIPIWNVMGVIPGHKKDEVVVVGNHRDAWVLGATDPSSGTVSTYEVIRGLGVLLKKGWKPLRTVVIASWDAEEYGLIGSTEWGEDFTDWIEEHVVAYLNLDSSVSGSRFGLSASPSLAHLVRNAAKDIPHPTTPGRSLWQARQDSGELFGDMDMEALEVHEQQFGVLPSDDDESFVASSAPIKAATTGVGALGSGSDYTVFLQRVGVASTNGGFGSTLHDPVYHYHSVFDSEPWQERYGDPRFYRHVAVAKHLGLVLLRIADAIILPLNTTQYAYELDVYLNKVEDIARAQNVSSDYKGLRETISALQAASVALDIEKAEAEEQLKKVFRKWRKSRRSCYWHWQKIGRILRRIGRRLGWKTKDGACHHEKLAAEETTAHEVSTDVDVKGHVKPRIGHFAGQRREEGDRMHRHKRHVDPALIKEIKEALKRVEVVNQKLASFERGFISKDGIKDREWYKHLGVAPGKWLGYGATTFPALTEALTIEKNTTLADIEAKRLEELLQALSETIQV